MRSISSTICSSLYCRRPAGSRAPGRRRARRWCTARPRAACRGRCRPGLGLQDPFAELVARPHQQVDVAATAQQLGAQRRVLRRQRRHLAAQLLLQRPAGHGAQALDRLGIGLRSLLTQQLGAALQHAHHRGGGQGFLRREVLVEAGLGDADIGRHLVDRHRVEALLGQQAVDGRDDRVLTNAQHLLSETTPGHAPL
jgi:hypothetical protein